MKANYDRVGRIAPAVALIFGITACGEPAPPPAPPPAQVRFSEVLVRDVPLSREWVGETRGEADVEIRARVPGFVEEIHFKEGSNVQKGQLLYSIDPSELLEQVATVEAELAAARTDQADAQSDVRRYRPLAEMKAVSQLDLENAEAREAAAASRVEAVEAQLRLARIKLSYTSVKAPIAGLIGSTQVQVGDFVGQPPSPAVLTAISRIEPIHVRFSINEKEYLELARKLDVSGGAPDRPAEGRRPLELILADDSVFPHPGEFAFLERNINSSTGTVVVDALFPNPGHLIRPGQYGRVRAVVDILKDARLVPQRAVQELQGQYQVWVVGEDNTVKVHQVRPGPRSGEFWVIEEGVEPGMRIVVEGLQRLRDGASVSASPFETPENG